MARVDDAATRDQTRTHLKEITQSFANGALDQALATHGEMPPGVATISEHKTGDPVEVK